MHTDRAQFNSREIHGSDSQEAARENSVEPAPGKEGGEVEDIRGGGGGGRGAGDDGGPKPTSRRSRN